MTGLGSPMFAQLNAQLGGAAPAVTACPTATPVPPNCNAFTTCSECASNGVGQCGWCAGFNLGSENVCLAGTTNAPPPGTQCSSWEWGSSSCTGSSSGSASSSSGPNCGYQVCSWGCCTGNNCCTPHIPTFSPPGSDSGGGMRAVHVAWRWVSVTLGKFCAGSDAGPGVGIGIGAAVFVLCICRRMCQASKSAPVKQSAGDSNGAYIALSNGPSTSRR